MAIEKQGDQIVFEASDDGNVRYYKTGLFPDDNLRERLEKAEVSFSATIPHRNSPLLNFMPTWILPTKSTPSEKNVITAAWAATMNGSNSLRPRKGRIYGAGCGFCRDCQGHVWRRIGPYRQRSGFAHGTHEPESPF